jgi:predicted dehydrogenase
MPALRVALIGGGGIARAHIAAAHDSGGRVEIAAVIDPADAACQAVSQSTGATPYPCVEDFLVASHREKSVDAAVVCTPPSVRVPIVEQLLANGLPVLVEKPLAHTLADSRRLQEIARAHPSIPTAVGYCHRFVPAVLEIKRRIEARELGTVLRFENTFAGWNARLREKWMSDPKLSGGGSFIDTGCHSLDLFFFLHGMGEVTSALFHHEWPGRGESSATVLLRSAEKRANVTGVIQSGWTEPGRFSVTVVGTAGLLHYDYLKPTELLYQPSEGAAQTLEIPTHETRFAGQMIAFADLVADPSRPRGLANFQDGFKVAEMVDQAIVSAQMV